MAFVNLPPNLQDMFYSLSDRIMKLETGPNQAMYTAEEAELSAQSASAQAASAQSVASQAQVQAINAGVTANNAAAQAVIAQSQATIASTQATVAQSTANGKNKVTYSTSAPGATANQVGDIWYQYGTSGTYANKVIAQFSGLGGNSWTSVTVSGLVIANIDAGAITTGTLSAIQITAGSGANSFNVSSTGVMSAQGVYVKGAIVADSGTFTGSIRADQGYFGTGSGATLINGWSIGANGLTGVGTGAITGGAITGSTITGGTVQTSTGSSAVILNGSSNAVQFRTSGSVVGNIVPLSSFGVLTHYGATADPSGGTFPQMFVGSANVSMFANSTNGIGVSTSGNSINGNTAMNNTLTYPGVATGAGTGMVVVTTGSRVAIVTSSERFKEDVKYITTNTGWLDKIEAMRPITYKTSEDFTTEGEPNETQIGFLAEDIYDLGGDLEKTVILDPLGDPFSLAYDRLTVFLTLAIKEMNARIKKLESN